MKKILSKLKDEKGQSAVEFALVGTLLLVLVFGITEFGRAWYRADKLKGAANIAARTFAVTSGDIAAKTSAGRAAADLVELGMGAKVSFPTALTTSVTATATEIFQPVTPVLLPMLAKDPNDSSKPFTITRTATYRLE